MTLEKFIETKTRIVDIHKKKGKRPEYDIYIGRDVKRTELILSKWHNPRLTLEEYELYIRHKIEEMPEYYNLNELKGKKLGCWCGITTDKLEPLVCHGQILLKLIKEKLK